MAVIHVGVDLGSTGLRAAYAASGATATTVEVAGADWPWLECEPATGAVPVSFPSVKSRLGDAEPTAMVTRALDAVRAAVLREPGSSIGRTVISVPARFFTTQRTALLAAAADAGLTDVSLLTDSVAAVIDQTADAETGTYLVYGMGYGGYEVGLVRAVRGTYRVLGYAGAAAPSGATLDAAVLGSWLAALGQQGAEVRSDWPRLQRQAEQVKWRLAAGESVLFPYAVRVPGGELLVQFDQSSFNRQVRTMVTATLEEIEALLTRVDVSPDAIDVVLLTGGATKMPVLAEVVSTLTRPLTVCDRLAQGALRHAHHLARHPTPSYDEPLPTPEPRTTQAPPPLTATVLHAPPQLAPQPSTLDNARRLIAAGRTEAARTELRNLVAEAQTLLDELDTPRPEPTGAATAVELIATARRTLAAGNPRNAIAIAHLAWRKDPNDVDVFEEMLDLHCTAAMANPTPATYEADEHWLRCALHHDPTNSQIRSHLAERHYLQGKDLLKAANREEAKRTLQEALKWAPEHQEATTLLRDLSPRRTP
jgi:hypothetical protein